MEGCINAEGGDEPNEESSEHNHTSNDEDDDDDTSVSETDDDEDDDDKENTCDEIQDSDAENEARTDSEDSVGSDEILGEWMRQTNTRAAKAAEDKSEKQEVRTVAEIKGKATDKPTSSSMGIDAPSFILMDEGDGNPDTVNVEDDSDIVGQNLDTLINAITTSETMKSLEAQLKAAKEAETKHQLEIAESQRREQVLEENLRAAKAREVVLMCEIKDSHKRVQDLEKDYNARLDRMQEQDAEMNQMKKKMEELTAKIAYMEGEKSTYVEPTVCTPLAVDATNYTGGVQAVPIQTRYPDPSSLVRNVKARQRRKRQDEQYTYDKKRGKTAVGSTSEATGKPEKRGREEDTDDFVEEIHAVDIDMTTSMGERKDADDKRKIPTTFEMVNKETKIKYWMMKKTCKKE